MIRKRTKLGRLLRLPRLMAECWDFASSGTLKERLLYCWESAKLLMRG